MLLISGQTPAPRQTTRLALKIIFVFVLASSGKKKYVSSYSGRYFPLLAWRNICCILTSLRTQLQKNHRCVCSPFVRKKKGRKLDGLLIPPRACYPRANTSSVLTSFSRVIAVYVLIYASYLCVYSRIAKKKKKKTAWIMLSLPFPRVAQGWASKSYTPDLITSIPSRYRC